jgi:hypothetical protein
MTATFNSKNIQVGAGFFYLALVPDTVVGLTPAAIVKELLETWLVSGDIRDTLKPGIKPWSRFEATGFKTKPDQKPVKVKPDNGPEYVIGNEEIGYGATMPVLDMDADKLADILSAVSTQRLTLAASSTQAGRTTILAGGQVNVNRYMGLYRYESRRVPGEFNHILILSCTLAITGDTSYNSSKAKQTDVALTAEASDLLLDPVTGRGVVWVEDTVTAAKS